MYDHALLYTNFASAIIANIACLIYNNDQTESYCHLVSLDHWVLMLCG